LPKLRLSPVWLGRAKRWGRGGAGKGSWKSLNGSHAKKLCGVQQHAIPLRRGVVGQRQKSGMQGRHAPVGQNELLNEEERILLMGKRVVAVLTVGSPLCRALLLRLAQAKSSRLLLQLQ